MGHGSGGPPGGARTDRKENTSGAERFTGGRRGWKVHYALFGRKGFTPAAREEMNKVQGALIDLNMLQLGIG